jgi:plasmid stabilization system protein ParE
MTRRVILRHRAQSDLRSAFRWYESQRAGLGDEFLRVVGQKLEVIGAFPKRMLLSIAMSGARLFPAFRT